MNWLCQNLRGLQSRKAALLFQILPVSLILLLSLHSCSQSKSGLKRSGDQDIVSQQLQNIGGIVESKPDSALILAGQAIEFAHIHHWNDTVIISLMQLKAKAFINLDIPDSAKVNYENARLRAILISDKQLQASIDLKLGVLMQEKGNVFTAEKYICEAFGLFDTLRNIHKTGEAYNLYGSLLMDKGDIIKSQQYLLKAYACFENTDNLSEISGICINIGGNYKARGMKKEALLYYRKALDFAEKAADTAEMSSALNNLGVFYRRSNPDSSMIYYNRSLALAPQGKNSLMEIRVRYNRANLYFDKNDFEEAKAEYFTLLDICRSGKNFGGIARIYTGLSAIHSKTHNYPLAEKYLTDAIALSDSLGDKKTNIFSLGELKDLYIRTGAYKKALDLSEIIEARGDSILGLKKQLAIHDMEMLSQSEKEDAENANLKYQVNRQQTKLTYRLIIIGILILATIGVLLLFRRLFLLYNQRTTAYDTLIKKYKTESELLSRLRSLKSAEQQIDAESEPVPCDTLLLERLIEYFVLEKPYLDPKLKVTQVAEKLGCSQKAIAAALKGYTDNNFNAFTNRFRVDAAISMMDDPACQHYKTDAIAKDSGFGSKSTFYSTFESFTGVRPGYYRGFTGDKERAGINFA